MRGRIIQQERTIVTAHVDVHEAQRLARRLGELRGETASHALGVGSGTLENLMRARVKSVPHWLMQRLRSVLADALASEMRRLQHEIDLCRQTGVDPRDDALAQAEAHLAKARAALRREPDE